MAAPTSNTRASNHERLDILATVDHLNALGQVTATSRSLANAQEQELAVLENSEPGLARATARELTLALLTLLIIPVAYLADILLFGELGEFIASQLVGNSPAIRLAGRLLTPAIIVALEMTLAARIHATLHAPVTAPAEGWQKILWVGLGVAMSVVMPLAAYATFQQLGVASGGWAPLSLLIILALVAHVPIIFGGTRALEAKSLILFRRRRRRVVAVIESASERAEHALQNIRASFPNYLHRLSLHNSNYEPAIPFGPFDSTTWAILQDLFPAEPLNGDLSSQAIWFRGINPTGPKGADAPADAQQGQEQG
ncbi:MAG TPA: hypothetical protein VFR81_10065 [Longimicrobium sp.]|nr:hypothetical protein [Longimicrobium sp.]